MNHQKAFTLVELSIVLVILGLLIGGVLTGQSLIRAAELRSVSTQYQRFYTAVQTFKDKYFAIPGDMANATAYWGRLASTASCVTNSAAAVSTSGVCDGNADGVILYDTTTAVGASNEMHQFWRQLAAAGLIEGNYTGLSGPSSGVQVLPGTNSPISKISAAGWGVGGGVTGSGQSFILPGGYGNYLAIGGPMTNNIPIANVFKPEEAYNIDMKTDDGLPGSGKIIAYSYVGYVATGCSTAASQNDLTGTYNLSYSGSACSLYYVKQF